MGLMPSAPLQGIISSSLLDLQYLNYLDLNFNDFGYTNYPNFIGSIKKLRYLNLSYAYFTGPIPHHFGNLSKLLYLDLSFNDYSSHGDNIDWISSLQSLEYIDLSYANLSMATNWVQVISKLTSIRELYLRGCKLPESLPSALPLSNASASLTILDLSGNYYELNRSLSPSTIYWFLNFSSSLTSIYLQFNNLQSPILDAFVNLISLAYLDLSSNMLESGITRPFGNMSNLVYLNLNDNHLTGQLSELTLNLSGPLQHKLLYLDLSLNNISGSFPNISRFSFLKELRLTGNQMNGSILRAHLHLPHLVVLDLSRNQFTGPVPDLSYCSSLEELYLHRNMFSGTLTNSIGGLSELAVLSLSSNHLKGTITEAHFISLSKLQILDLSSNSLLTIKMNSHWILPFQLDYMNLAHCKLGPQFPKWLRTQKYLSALDISDARIADAIPNWFGSIPRTLFYLNASNNRMYGSFPKISFTTVNSSRESYFMKYPLLMEFYQDDLALDLSRNQFSGSINFLCCISDWTLLDLSHNLFSDQLPDCFATFKNFEYLNLANNHFSGKIPTSFGFLTALSWLHLRNNSFSGRIPTSMRNCTSLQMIDLGENSLSGKVPTWIGDSLSQVVVLSLRKNEFHGNIPSSICRLANVQVLDLSLNRISGAIPECLNNLTAMTNEQKYDLSSFQYYVGFFNLLTNLDSVKSGIKLESASIIWKGKDVEYKNNLQLVKLIDLSSNNLAGEIPSKITALVGLIGLNFSKNNLTGSIPENIGQITSLNFLDFSRNYLSGGIPTSLCELSHLGVFDLSNNNLSGRVPQCTQLLTFNGLAYMGNPGLCGPPINNSCPGDDDDGIAMNQTPDFEYDKFINEGFYIAMGLGFVVAFWGIFGTILFNSPFKRAVDSVFNTVGDYTCLRLELSKARFQN